MPKSRNYEHTQCYEIFENSLPECVPRTKHRKREESLYDFTRRLNA